MHARAKRTSKKAAPCPVTTPLLQSQRLGRPKNPAWKQTDKQSGKHVRDAMNKLHSKNEASSNPLVLFDGFWFSTRLAGVLHWLDSRAIVSTGTEKFSWMRSWLILSDPPRRCLAKTSSA